MYYGKQAYSDLAARGQYIMWSAQVKLFLRREYICIIWGLGQGKRLVIDHFDMGWSLFCQSTFFFFMTAKRIMAIVISVKSYSDLAFVDWIIDPLPVHIIFCFSVGFLESTFMLEAVNKNEVQSGPTNTGADGNRKTENRKQTNWK